MWFHGWWTNGERWPFEPGEADARAAMRRRGYDQFTQVAESSDGIHFVAREAISKQMYLRVFQHRSYFYGLSEPGVLSRSADPLLRFEVGPNPFRDGPYANRVRHVAFVARGTRLYVFFTAVGDTPERVLASTIDLTPDWTSWRATSPVDVLQPETIYECADLPIEPSRRGAVMRRVRQIRDPFVFEESGKMFLFYAICGEQGIAAAEITLR